MPQVSVLAGAQDIQMDHAVIIAANTVSEDFHRKVHANLHIYRSTTTIVGKFHAKSMRGWNNQR